MEETTPTFIQEYFGEYGIMGSIIVILLFIIGFLYLRQKYPNMKIGISVGGWTTREERGSRLFMDVIGLNCADSSLRVF